MSNVILALTRGRLLESAQQLLQRAGIEPVESLSKTRKLLVDSTHDGLRILVLRGLDVITTVARGAAHLGIVGQDLLLEVDSPDIYELMDLQLGACRIMTAALPGAGPIRSDRVVVAAKLVNVAQKFYASRGRPADIVHLHGGLELAPLLNLSDEILDIVSTGETLRANGLEPLETVAHCSARLIVNKAAMKTCPEVADIAEALAGALERVA